MDLFSMLLMLSTNGLMHSVKRSQGLAIRKLLNVNRIINKDFKGFCN